MKNVADKWNKNCHADDMPEHDQIELIEKLRQELSAQVGQDIQYALWLADKACVQNSYNGRNSDIECYETSNVILSDLEQRGILFGYEFEPFPSDI